MPTLDEKLSEHLSKHGLKEHSNVSKTHEYSHVILELNGIKESNLSFRSEEMQLVMHLALFRDEVYRYGNNIISMQIFEGNLNNEIAQVKPILEKVRNNIFLPWYRDLKVGEVIRDDYINNNPDDTRYTEEGLVKRYIERNEDDFMQFKLNELSSLRGSHRNISLDTAVSISNARQAAYEGQLTEKEIFKIYEIGFSIRKNFYKNYAVHIDEVKEKELGNMDCSNFTSSRMGIGK